MVTASFALTAAIAVLALVDIAITLLPLTAPANKGSYREKYGFRSQGKSAMCRSVCFAGVVSLAIALVLARGEIGERRGWTSFQSFSLAALFAFNLAINLMMFYSGYFSRRGVARVRNNVLLPVTGNSCTKVKELMPCCNSSSTDSQLQRVPSLSPPDVGKAADLLPTHLSIKVHAGPVEGALPERLLDRRDSDCMLRGSSGRREKGKAFMEPACVPENDEALLDALMHDTIKVLVEG